MSSYVYGLFDRDTNCTECMGDRKLLLVSTKKWVVTQYIKGVLEAGLSIANYEVTRARDSIPGGMVNIDPYEFMQIDMGETL